MSDEMKVLTNEERLELANLQLQRRVIEMTAQQQMAGVAAKEAAMIAGIEERLDIDLKAFQVNLDNGSLVPIPAGPRPVPNPPN
jgi:hypothetical protein